MGKVTSVDETPHSSLFKRKMLEVIFPFPPHILGLVLKHKDSFTFALTFILFAHFNVVIS